LAVSSLQAARGGTVLRRIIDTFATPDPSKVDHLVPLLP
jgi:hypothetical protein